MAAICPLTRGPPGALLFRLLYPTRRNHDSEIARRRAIAVVALLVLGATLTLQGQTGALNGEWRTYGGDLASTRYAPLDQINATNFSKLEVAWRFRPDSLGPRLENNLQVTPLVANGRMYLTAGARRAVVSLDPVTGEMLWMHSINEGPRAAASPRQQSGRGLAYWTDGKEERVLYVTTGYQLIALDAKTGHRIAAFGTRRHCRSQAGLRSANGPRDRRSRPGRPHRSSPRTSC